MAIIAFMLDVDPGHIFPSLGVIKEVQEAGHEVHVFGIKDIKQYLKNYDYSFHSIFENTYPEGFLIEYKQLQKNNTKMFLENNSIPRPHFQSILDGELTVIFNKINIDFLVLTFSLSLEAFVLRMMYPKINFLICTTWLRNLEFTPKKLSFEILDKLENNLKSKIIALSKKKKSEDFFFLLDSFTEIILCPKEFRISKKKTSSHVYHLGSILRKNTKSIGFIERLKIPEEKKIIYLSMGSQTALFEKKALKLFRIFYELISLEADPNFFFILSIGNEIKDKKLISIPNKIEVEKWVPQLEILNKTSLMITHGGLGTIKECIEYEVPMLVIPMIYDQFDNAKRIEYHGLGKSVNIDSVSMENLNSLINNMLCSNTLKGNIKKMKNNFCKDNLSTFKTIFNSI